MSKNTTKNSQFQSLKSLNFTLKIPNSTPLGIYTKFQSTPINRGLQRVQKSRLVDYALQNHAQKLLPKNRVSYCLRQRICKTDNVWVKYNTEREKAHYSNLQRCGSIWVCPVCAKNITEKRRAELKQATDRHKKNGGFVYLLTLTNRHHVGDNLDELLQGQKRAIAYLWGDRKPKEHLKALGKIGHIITTEVTHGVNGWHPHYHILLFMDKPLDVKKLQRFLAEVWQNCCRKAKLAIPSLVNGVDVSDGSYADKYVAKWGLEHEMTKGHVKKGREGGRTPFDLLRDSAMGDIKAGNLFKYFTCVFKGKQQLHWTRGLKKLLLVEEKSDEELATETEKTSIDFCDISFTYWVLILKYKQRANFLACVERDCQKGEGGGIGSSITEKFLLDLALYDWQRMERQRE